MREQRGAARRRLPKPRGTPAGTGQDSGDLARRVAARQQEQKRQTRAKCRRRALVTSHRAAMRRGTDPRELAARQTFAVQARRRPAVVEVSAQRQPKAVGLHVRDGDSVMNMK